MAAIDELDNILCPRFRRLLYATLFFPSWFGVLVVISTPFGRLSIIAGFVYMIGSLYSLLFCMYVALTYGHNLTHKIAYALSVFVLVPTQFVVGTLATAMLYLSMHGIY